jgi:hypothetical protein
MPDDIKGYRRHSASPRAPNLNVTTAFHAPSSPNLEPAAGISLRDQNVDAPFTPRSHDLARGASTNPLTALAAAPDTTPRCGAPLHGHDSTWETDAAAAASGADLPRDDERPRRRPHYFSRHPAQSGAEPWYSPEAGTAERSDRPPAGERRRPTLIHSVYRPTNHTDAPALNPELIAEGARLVAEICARHRRTP